MFKSLGFAVALVAGLASAAFADEAWANDAHVMFKYGGAWFTCDKPVSETPLPGGKGWTSKRREYRTPDGLLGVRVTWKFYTDYPAAEYLPEIYATGDKPTKIVEKYASFALQRKFAGKNPYDEKSLRIRAIVGDRIHRSQFMPETHWLHEGGVVAFGAVGRSSDAARHFRMTDRSAIGVEPLTDMLWRGDPMRDDHMPYLCFDFPDDGGLDLAIGWSGSWRCDCTKFNGLTELKAGLMGSHFKVLPGEMLRTPSIVLLRRAPDITPRAFRTVKHRFIRAFKSPRDAEGNLFKPLMPLTSDGGMKTDQMMIDIIKWATDNKLCRDGFWIDAGWNGYAKKVDPLDWSQWRDYHGSWIPNRISHPDGNFKRVSAAAHAAGMKFILWCEPERLRPDSDLAKSLPEEAMLTWKERPGSVNWATGPRAFKVLNLGHPKGCEAAISTLSRLIDDSNIDVYRQDCNIEYLAQYWEGNDTADRRGITEMKHIAGLYRFWDTLRAKYPNLLIDNCASGGRRLDVELNSRSHCYCRSDYYISNYGEDQLSSAQNATLNTLDIQPFQGSESTPGKFGDEYGLFSATGPALVFTPGLRGYYSKEGITPEHLKWLQKLLPVCDRMRTFFMGDFYPQTEPTGLDRDVWCAYQMHRPDLNAGFVMAFRRPEAPNDTLAVDLGGIDPNATYAVENWDGKSLGTLCGAALKTKPVKIAKKRDFALFFYRKVTAAAEAAQPVFAPDRFTVLNIVPSRPGHEQEVAADCIRFAQETGQKVALYSLTLHPEGRPAMNKVNDLLASYRAFVAALAGSDIRPGILIQAIIGHWPRTDKDIEPWMRTVNISGKEVRFCPLDPDFRAYIRAVAEGVAREKPCFILSDDDVRAYSHEAECFCARHTAEFSKRMGRPYTSAAFRAAISQAKPGSKELAVFAALQKEMVLDVAAQLRSGIDAVDPAIPSGVCCATSAIRYVGDEAKAMAGPRHDPVFRVNNALYMENSPKALANRLKHTMALVALNPDIPYILDESDTFPHNLWSKASVGVHAKMDVGILAGLKGSKLWFCGMHKNGYPVSPNYTRVFADHRGHYDALVREMAGSHPYGILEPVLKDTSDWQPAKRGSTVSCPYETGTWTDGYAGVMGVPFAMEADLTKPGVWTLSGAKQIARLTEGELRTILSHSVLIDARAAEALGKRGLAALTGVTTDHQALLFNGEISADGRQSYAYSHAAVPHLVPMQGATPLSFLTYSAYAGGEKTRVAPASTLFTNALGGRVIVSTFNPNIVNYCRYNEARKAQFEDFIAQLNGSPLVTVANEQDVLAVARQKENGDIVLTVVNLNFDALTTLDLHVSRPLTSIEELDGQGNWQPLTWRIDGSVVRISRPLACYEALALSLR